MSKVLMTASLLVLSASVAFAEPQSGDKIRTPRATERQIATAVQRDDEVRRLVDSVLTVMERERVISRKLQEEQSRGSSESNTRNERAFMEELQAINVQKMRLQSRLASWCNQSQQPQGWMGITFSGTYLEMERATRTIRFDGYPRIEAVEPESPAQRAGMMVGDTIVTLEGDDLRGQVVSFASLLRPGSTLLATVRRDGGMFNVKMRIESRPKQAENRCGEVNSAIAAALANPVIDVIRLGGEYAYAYSTSTPRAPRSPTTPRPSQAPTAPEAVLAPMPPRLLISSGGMPRMLAGAEIVLTEKEVLRDIFGAPNGVWVSRVLQGSPAFQSGLRAGDVIVMANGEKIISPLGLQRAIVEADDRDALKLSVIRKKKPVTIMLRWSGNRD